MLILSRICLLYATQFFNIGYTTNKKTIHVRLSDIERKDNIVENIYLVMDRYTFSVFYYSVSNFHTETQARIC